MTRSVTIVGLGYVGLPLAYEACRNGLKVVGLDIDATVVAGLVGGLSHIDDLRSVDISEMQTAGFKATSDPACIESSDVVVICVPTPLDEEGTPDLAAVRAAA